MNLKIKHKMDNPLVSVISVHYNGVEFTEAFINSILKITYEPIEVIIVDNGSPYEPIEPLISKYPEVKFIVSEDNLGFAGGNNLGMKVAKGQFFLFLNNDTEVPENFLEPIMDHFKTHPDTGMVSPLIKYFNTNIIQYAGNGAINLLTGRSERAGINEEDKGQYNFNYRTEMIHGAALMVRKSVIDEIGLMPEIYFLYYEEIDWCIQAQVRGYETWVIGESQIFHKESMSVGKDSPFKLYYMTRNRVLFLRRNTKGLQKLSWVLFFIFFTIPKNSIVYLLKGHMKSLRAFYKGLLYNLRSESS